MKERNIAAHRIGGDDVISMLPHCEPTLRGVLERAFHHLWGVPVGGWGGADVTPEQRSRIFEY